MRLLLAAYLLVLLAVAPACGDAASDTTSAGESSGSGESGTTGAAESAPSLECDGEGHCWRTQLLPALQSDSELVGLPEFGDLDGDGFVDVVFKTEQGFEVFAPLSGSLVASLAVTGEVKRHLLVPSVGLLLLNADGSSSLHRLNGESFADAVTLGNGSVARIGVVDPFLPMTGAIAWLEEGAPDELVIATVSDSGVDESLRVPLPEGDPSAIDLLMFADFDADNSLDLMLSVYYPVGYFPAAYESLIVFDLTGERTAVPTSFLTGPAEIWRPAPHFARSFSNDQALMALEFTGQTFSDFVTVLEYPIAAPEDSFSASALAIDPDTSTWVAVRHHANHGEVIAQPWIQRVGDANEFLLSGPLGVGEACDTSQDASAALGVLRIGAGGVEAGGATELLLWVDRCGDGPELWAAVETQ